MQEISFGKLERLFGMRGDLQRDGKDFQVEEEI